MRCFNCGSEISETDKFCKHCGICLDYSEETIKLEDDDIETMENENVACEPHSQFRSTNPNLSIDEFEEPIDKINKPLKSKTKKRILTVLFVLAMLILTIFIFRHQIIDLIYKMFEEITHPDPCCAFPPDDLR